jgi:diaminopimelate epimerase
VENETLSCGTGVTACALAASLVQNSQGAQKFTIETKGGQLFVDFLRDDSSFSEIILTGPAVFVFNGVINV